MTSQQLVRLDVDGDTAVMVIDNPPVNALSPAVAVQMSAALDDFERHPDCAALVVACVGRTFVAGGDIAAFEDPDFTATPLNRTLARLERLQRPVVAALHGFVLGGGLELAMACHWRVADLGTRLGLPEIKLGLIPGSLGTQRLPRLVGMARAHEMILSGDSVTAPLAHGWGLVDAVAEGDVTRAAVAFARTLVARGTAARPTCDRAVDMTGVPAGFFAQQRQRAYEERARFPAALLLADALEAATGPFDAGEAVETRGFELLRRSSESKALRYLFFAQRKTARSGAADTRAEDDPTHRAFTRALATLRDEGVSPQRLARALQGFGFTALPHGLEAPSDATPLLDEPQLVRPLLDAVVDEAARLLEAGLCARASDIDVAWTRTHGFPAFLGGPLYNADASGLHRVVERLAGRGQAPCRLLRALAQTGARLSEQRASEPPPEPT